MKEFHIIDGVNHKSPPFPCTAILFSKNPGNTAFDIISFSTQRQFDSCRAMTMAAIRVLLRPDDLNDVNRAVLRMIYNFSRPDFPVTEFPDTPENRALVIRLAREAATPYKENSMSDENTATAEAPAATSTEAKAAQKKAEREAKLATEKKAKEEAKAKREEERGNGVIGTIRKALDTVAGTTQNEILDELVKKFPNRTRDGMASTVKIQFSRLQKSTNRDIHNAVIEGRGRVYKFADKGPVPGKVQAEAAPAGTAEAPVAPAPGPDDKTPILEKEPSPVPTPAAKGGKAAGKGK